MDNFVDGMAEVFDHGSLRTFLRAKLGKRLSGICGSQLPIREICARVDEVAELKGWRRKLIEKARDEFPDRQDFQQLCDAELSGISDRDSNSEVATTAQTINRVIICALLVAAAIWCLKINKSRIWKRFTAS